MSVEDRTREEILEELNCTVVDAAAFFSTLSPIVAEGRYTAHGVLAQLVYWHERYVEVLRALAVGQQPSLIDGTYDALDASARHHYASEPMVMLAERLNLLHHELDGLLRTLPDWSVEFPVKHNCESCSVYERVELIHEQIHAHTAILKRAAPKY